MTEPAADATSAPGTNSLLEREIAEQGQALACGNEVRAAAAAGAARALRAVDVSHVIIAGRGSSGNAARFAQYLFGSQLRLPVGLAAPWLYRDPARAPWLERSAVVAISQSGRSPDIISVLEAARRQRRPTIAITADLDAPLARHADAVVAIGVSERSVAATKTYTATLAAIVQIVEAIAPDPIHRHWLTELPALVDETAKQLLATRSCFDPLLGLPLLTVTGRGLAYSAACETALKVRELAGMPAEAFSLPDLMHGPVAALDGRGAVWSIEPTDDAAGILNQAAVSIVVGACTPKLRGCAVHIALPLQAPAWVRALLSVIPGQVAGLRLAERLGVEIDRPHGLTKITQTH